MTQKIMNYKICSRFAIFIDETNNYLTFMQGELEDVIPFVEQEGSSFNRLVFLPPAMMDLLATSTMYVGLNMTFASSFQMLRGAVIVFTGLLSVAFLNRKLNFIKWFGIFFVILGLAVVGLSDFSSNASSGFGRNNMITGTAEKFNHAESNILR